MLFPVIHHFFPFLVYLLCLTRCFLALKKVCRLSRLQVRSAFSLEEYALSPYTSPNSPVILISSFLNLGESCLIAEVNSHEYIVFSLCLHSDAKCSFLKSLFLTMFECVRMEYHLLLFLFILSPDESTDMCFFALLPSPPHIFSFEFRQGCIIEFSEKLCTHFSICYVYG